MGKKKPIGYVIFHRGGGGVIGFDVFARPKFAKRYGKVIDFYDVDCPVSKEFKKNHPGYKFLGSEDLGHTVHLNNAFRSILIDLEKKGFELIFMDDINRHEALRWRKWE